MPERGLEPPPSYLDKNLNLARLPIPPLGRVDRSKRREKTAYQPRQPTQDWPLFCRICPAGSSRRRREKIDYSTVTLLARFRGLSTSQPRSTAMW